MTSQRERTDFSHSLTGRRHYECLDVISKGSKGTFNKHKGGHMISITTLEQLNILNLALFT